MKADPIDVVDLGQERLEQLLERVKTALPEDDFADLGRVVTAYQYLLRLIEMKNISLERLRKIIFGSKSEKTSEIFKGPPENSASSGAPMEDAATLPADEEDSLPEQKRKGHGRNGAAAYTGAERQKVSHPSMKPGDVCPECKHGKVYAFTPGTLVRLKGQAPIGAIVYEVQNLRCNGCQRVFPAPLPPGIPYTKHDASAGAMIALLRYGTGVPFNRLDHLQQNLGVPLPAGTQWGIIEEAGAMAEPAFQELINQAAQGKVLHNDDTNMKIMELIEARKAAEPDESQRKGCFTTGIISLQEDHKIALFFTGPKHAGENLKDVLKRRAAALKPPIQMCDALSRNIPAELETILANCTCHLRRQFVDVAECFPDECKHLLETLKEVYKHDAITKQQGMPDDARLAYHQEHSGGLMKSLKAWAQGLFEQKLVEPNSGLGAALNYMLKHWEPLTLFLRQTGAPLDNNIAERGLKKAIRHRRNSLFYKTLNGAHVGDVFMSLIHTAEMEGVNPLRYLTALLEHSKQVAKVPSDWMPWNYQRTLPGPEAAVPGG